MAQRGGRTARARTRPTCDLAEQAARGAHDRGPVRRHRLRAAQEPRRERPGQRGRSSAWATSTSSAPGPTSRSTYFSRVKEGQIVELQPRLQGIAGAHLPIEQKRFRGKITFVDPQIQPVAETAVRIYAEFENKDQELRPGLKGVMTIYLTPDGVAAAPRRHRRSERGPPGPHSCPAEFPDLPGVCDTPLEKTRKHRGVFHTPYD